MIEISNSKNYKQYISLVTVILVAGFGILFIFRPNNILLSVGLFIFFELIFLSEKFTHKICIGDNNIRIIYYKWGIKNLLEFDVKDARAEVSKIVASRGYKSKSLNIFLKNKLIYRFKTNEGFSEEDIYLVEKRL